MERRLAVIVVILVAVVAGAAAYMYTQSLIGEKTSTLPKPLEQLARGKPAAIDVVIEGVKGTRAPRVYTCDSPNPQPPRIDWNPANDATAYIIVVLDPDAPHGVFIHLVAYDGSATHWPSPDYKLGVNSAGHSGWYPICPPPGDKPHRYYFVVFALKEPLGLPPGATLNEVVARARDKVLAYGYTIVTYQR